MKPSIPAALLLAFAPACVFGEFDPAILETHIQGCGDVQKDKIKSVVKMAFDDFAGNCLIDGGLNPPLGQKIQAMVTKNDLTYKCASETHEFEPPSTVNLRVTDSPGAPSAGAGAVVMHEFIHGVDPSDNLVTSFDLHNLGSFPDGVFGCHVACLGKVGGTAPMEWVAIVEAASGLTIVPMDWARCKEGNPAMCRTVGQFASMCQNGPVPKSSFKRPLGDLPIGFCLLQKLKKGACTDKACAPATAKLGDILNGPESPQDVLRQLAQLLFQTLDAKRSGGPQDNIGFMGAALISQGLVQACESAPDNP